MIHRWPPGSVLNLPLGREWWWPGGAVVADERHLWWEAEDGAVWSAAGRWREVHELPGGFVAWEDAGGLRVVGGVPTRTAGRPTAHGEARREGRGWVVDGRDLPEGAERARALWTSPDAAAVWWWSEGFLYRWDSAIRALASHDAPPLVTVGPGGAAVVEGRWGAAPGGSLVPLAARIDATRFVRFAADGSRVAGATDDARSVVLDLRTGAVLERSDGLPVDLARRWLPDLGIVAERPPSLEGTPACAEGLLAGPAGAIWDLARGARRSAPGVVPLGVTLPLPGGFLTAHWQTGEVVAIDADGAPRWTSRVPLAADEVLVRGVAADPLEIVTSEGIAWAVGPGTATRLERRTRRPKPDPLPPSPVPVEGAATVGGTTWGWRADGLLCAIDRAEPVTPGGGPRWSPR